MSYVKRIFESPTYADRVDKFYWDFYSPEVFPTDYSREGIKKRKKEFAKEREIEEKFDRLNEEIRLLKEIK